MIIACAMRSDQTGDLGIPGSTRITRPEGSSLETEKTIEEIAKTIALAAANDVTAATVHMLQHFRQPWSSAGGGALSAAIW